LTRTFLDAGVLIAATRGTGSSYRKAMEVLDDDRRSFVSSPFVRLEVLPKALFHKRLAEIAFYESYFEAVKDWIGPDDTLIEEASRLGARFGLSAVDALHVAAATMAGADELVTSEKPGRPIHRVASLSVKTIHL
jgi:predicted nucleic acid-binding protein